MDFAKICSVMPSEYDRPEQRGSQAQRHEQLCERCGRELGRQAVRRSDMSQIDVPLRNNAFSYFPDERTPEERADQWERLKRSMDRVASRSGERTYSRTADELANRDRERILGLIDLLEKSSN